MKRKKMLADMHRTLNLLNLEVDMEQDEEKKSYLRGVAAGFAMGITKVEKTYKSQTVYEEITKSPKTLAKFILSDPCVRNPKKFCEEGIDCESCMLGFITDRLQKPAETLNATGICDTVKGVQI